LDVGKTMNTQDYILKKFQLNYHSRKKMPLEIPNFGRDQLPTLFNELNFKVGAEIGVEKGTYSKTICEAIPGVQLYCIDAWTTYDGYDVFRSPMDTNYIITKERLKDYNCIIIRKFSVDASKDFEDGSLDFVYIDAAHDFQSVSNDIAEWSKKVRVDGIVAGHDYTTPRKPNIMHVEYVVNAYTAANSISPWFVLGHKEKIEGEIRDHERSWMWAKT